MIPAFAIDQKIKILDPKNKEFEDPSLDISNDLSTARENMGPVSINGIGNNSG